MEFGGGTQYICLDTLNGTVYEQVLLRSHEGVERGTGLNGYVTLQKRWGGFTAKLGLRGEQEWKHSTWNYLNGTGTTEVDTAFFGLVPSIHLSYQTKTFTSYSLSYTRRHRTPGMTQLSTFRRFDDYSYETGNPNLLISYTHNLEAAFNKYIMGFGNIGINAYYRANTDEIGTMAYAGYAPEYFGPVLVNYKQLPDKHLLVRVPRSLKLDNVEMNGLGQNFVMDGVRCETLEMNNVSNQITLNECEIDDIEVNCVSTDVEATFSKMPNSIEMNNVSGSTVLYVPEDAGITLQWNGLFADFHSELPVATRGKKKVIGNGACAIESNSVSGELDIKVKRNN